ncbi:hypothetical protein UPYG_G00078620 [Umbra pygmaea]|uniref:Uncharacterized protein n=1 Tax=Umbra pygmaea TaxID=75934 RepID=A0ABD0Y2P9_UMBPY
MRFQVAPSCSPVGWATPSTPRRHLEYQVKDFSSTREEYLDKIERQTEEIVHMRAQLALQSGPGYSDLVHCLSVKAGSGNNTSFRDLFLRTIFQRAIRKNAATQDATDEAVQNQVTRYLKGAADRAGGRRGQGGPGDLP